MAGFKHTERTREIWRTIAGEYWRMTTPIFVDTFGFECDVCNVEKIEEVLEDLRIHGEAMTTEKSVAEWLKKHGCNVYMIADRWKVQL